MKEKRRYNIEGAILDIPLHFDETAGIYIEDYPDFIEEPVWTPQGHRIMFSGEEACEYGEEATPGGCPDCGSCKFYRAAEEHTWLGVCLNDKQSKKEKAKDGHHPV